MQKKKSVALVGCGNLGRMIIQAILDNKAGPYEVIGVTDYSADAAKALAQHVGCKAVGSVEELIVLRPDFVLEATCPDAAKQYVPKVLASGTNMIMLSVGALADAKFCENASEIALEHDSKLYIPSGAVGGFDLMGAAMVGGDVKASITTRKPPKGLQAAPCLKDRVLPLDRAEEVFSGNAREAIALFPQNVNVAVATGAASVGVENLPVRIISDPAMTRNCHTIELEGNFGRAKIEIEAKPSPESPRSSALAAMSVVALLKKLSSPIVI